MAKELYLYSPIYSFVAESVLSQIEDNMENEVTLRVLTPGGSVFAAYGIYTKMKEHGNITLKVDGAADSAGSFLPLYAKNTECLNVSRFTFHRADMFVENEQEQSLLDGVNKDLKAQMLKKIDADKWLEVTGITIEQLFDPATRIDVTLTGKQAKEVGLVQKVINLTPEVEKSLAAFNEKLFNTSANNQTINNSKPNTMNIEKLKAEHPALYTEVFALGKADEKDRVESILAFVEIDPIACKTAIESGKDLTRKQMSDFTIKAMSKETLNALKDESATSTPTAEADEKVKTEKTKSVEAFEASVDEKLNIKKTA